MGNNNQNKMPTKNIIVVSSPSLAANRSRRGGTDKNYSLWGGGSTTVVSPDSASNGDVILAELECVPSVVKYKVNTENSPRPRQNKRKAEEELLDPEEDEKKDEEEQEPPGCRSLQTEETGPDRGAAVHPGRSQEHLLAPGEGGAGH